MQYIMDEKGGAELIVAEDSRISYPLHNHISVDVFGLVTKGSIRMAIRSEEKVFKVGNVFYIPAYAPHALEATETYSLLTLCIAPQRNYCARQDMMELKELLARFPERKISLNEMAEKIYASKFQMLRNFKKEVGLTPHQFQLQNKIRKAQRLLQGQVNLTKVAYDTGFYDQSHFIRQFEKIVGLTPTEYQAAFSRKAFLVKKPENVKEAEALLIQSGNKLGKKA